MSKKTNRIARQALMMSVSVSLMGAFAAQAQTSDADADEARKLDKVVVSSTKREQTLQDTPIAVSVVSGETLQRAEILDVLDLQSIVPSLRVSPSVSQLGTSFSIRGFGSASNNAGIEPSVGVFVDGIYRSRTPAALSDFTNIERIEVLRGPQSTLFGKNASVGVVSILTKAPEFESGGSASFTYANNNTIRLAGDFTGPISDKVAFRLSGSYNKGDGYAENLATGNDVNDRNRWGIQGQLLFTPSDDLSVRLMADYDEIDEVCCIQTNVVAGATTRGLIAALGDIVIEDPFSYEYYANFDPTNEINNGGLSVHVDKEFGFADFTSITSYRESDTAADFDIDQSTGDILNSFNSGGSETFTQEFRLTSNAQDATVDWLVGAYFFDETISFPGGLAFGADTRTFFDVASGGGFAALEGILGLPVGTFRQDGERVLELRGQDNTSWSLFGTADWHLTDQLTATVGLGYIYDEKDAFVTQINDDAFSQIDLVALGFGLGLAGAGVDPTDAAAVAAFAAANPTAFAAIQAGAQNPATNPALALAPLQTLPQTLAIPNAVEDGHSEDDELTYSLRLAYDFNDNLNIYASYATGFKATAWNLSRDSRPSPADFIPGSPVTNPASSPIRDAGLAIPNLRTGSRFAGPETSEVIELGLKADFDTFTANVAIFEQSVEDFQTNVLTGTSGRILANADKQSSTGFEIETTWSPIDNLILSFAGTFLDAEYDSFPDSAFGDLTGRTPAGIPDISTSTAFQYSFDVNGLDSFVRADWQHSEGAAYSDNSALQDFIGFTRDFDLVNASAGFNTQNGISVSVWGRNIFDEEYFNSVFTPLFESTSLAGFPNQPATYGVTVRKTF
ncbi:MAG: TonB-dependent receptor [Pseudomonadota bacterium]